MKIAIALSFAALLAACAGAPEVRFHSLSAPDRSSAPAPVAAQGMVAGSAPRLVISAVKVPAAVDQPQWLVRRADDTLQALEQDRWASPLGEEFRAALREGLGRRWGVIDGSLPSAAPAASASAPAPAPSSWRLMLEVLRLEARPGSDTLLEARWTLLPPRAGAASTTCGSTLREQVSGDGTVPLADAHRRAVRRLTDDIGRQLQALASGSGSGACLAGA